MVWSPRARHLGLWSQVGLRKHYCNPHKRELLSVMFLFSHALININLILKNVFKNIVIPFVALINIFCEIAMMLILKLMKLDYNWISNWVLMNNYINWKIKIVQGIWFATTKTSDRPFWHTLGFFGGGSGGLICFFGHGMRDLTSRTSSTVPFIVKAQNPNHWTARELPDRLDFKIRTVKREKEGQYTMIKGLI